MVTTDWDEAKNKADEDGKAVGAYVDNEGVPHYFLHEPGMDETAARKLAFEIREGRPMSAYEEWVLEVAMRRHEAGVPV